MDTSVFGRCFEKAFLPSSRIVFERARAGRIIVLVSSLVSAELECAPDGVRRMLDTLPGTAVEFLPASTEVEVLKDAYMEAGVVGPRSETDAMHVAFATVARADAIVSWNFRHIVRLDRIKSYNRVNWEKSYGVLTIVSPQALVGDGTEDESESEARL